MAIFAANRSLRISLELQSRSVLIPSSLAKKNYNTSIPVRYTPKTHNLNKNAQKAPLLEGYDGRGGGYLFEKETLKGTRGASKFRKFDEKKEHQSSPTPIYAEYSKSSDIFKQTEELLEYEDADSSALELMDTNALSKSETILDETLDFHEDKVTETDELLTSNMRQEAENLAIGLLAARAITEYELQKKLRDKKYPPNIVESVMADIKRRGLLNDGFYAESFSRSKWLSSTWGPRRIKQTLKKKGVNEVEVEKAMKSVFQGDDDLDGDGQNMKHGMSKLAMGHLFHQATKQWIRGGENTSYENRKARVVRWLQYRGFNWGVTHSILKKLEAHYPP